MTAVQTRTVWARGRVAVLVGGQRLANVHPRSRCDPWPCPIHNPTSHHMRSWPQHYRADRQLMERLCPHGIGHPDPDDINIDGVHGCDGCCVHPPPPLAIFAKFPVPLSHLTPLHSGEIFTETYTVTYT